MVKKNGSISFRYIKHAELVCVKDESGNCLLISEDTSEEILKNVLSKKYLIENLQK